jgi:hypothetical protein
MKKLEARWSEMRAMVFGQNAANAERTGFGALYSSHLLPYSVKT